MKKTLKVFIKSFVVVALVAVSALVVGLFSANAKIDGYIYNETTQVYYQSLKEAAEGDSAKTPAIVGAADGDVLKVIRDIPATGGANRICFADGITLDLNGKTIYSGQYDLSSDANSNCYIFEGKNLKIKNGNFSTNFIKENMLGTVSRDPASTLSTHSYAIFIGDGTNETSVTIEDVNCINGGINCYESTCVLNNVNVEIIESQYACVWGDRNANITINSGNYVNNSTNPQSTGMCLEGHEGDSLKDAVYVAENEGKNFATITVNDGDFIGKVSMPHPSNAYGGTITINGGNFSTDVTDFLAKDKGVTLLAQENSFLYYADDSIQTTNYTVDSAHAQVGDKLYASFKEAYDDIDEEFEGTTTIKLLKNDTFNKTIGITKDLIIDLGGYSLTAASGKMIWAEGADVEIKNGKIVIKKDNGIQLYGTNEDETDFTYLKIDEDVELEVGYYAVSMIKSKQSDDVNQGIKVDFYGKTNGGFYTNGTMNVKKDYAPVINIYEDSECGFIYAAGYAKWSIDGKVLGPIEQDDTIAIKSGKFVFDENAYVVNTVIDYKDPVSANYNGADTSGAAITILSNDTYKSDVEIEIKGGTYISKNQAAIYEGIEINSGSQTGAATKSHLASIAIKGGNFITYATNADVKSAIRLEDFNDTTNAKKCATGGFYTKVEDKYIADGYKAVATSNATYGNGFLIVENTQVQVVDDVNNVEVNKTDFTGAIDNFESLQDKNDFINDFEDNYAANVYDFGTNTEGAKFITVNLQAIGIKNIKWDSNDQSTDTVVTKAVFDVVPVDQDGNVIHNFADMVKFRLPVSNFAQLEGKVAKVFHEDEFMGYYVIEKDAETGDCYIELENNEFSEYSYQILETSNVINGGEAVVKDKVYDTIEAAFDDAGDGDTIYLVKDVTKETVTATNGKFNDGTSKTVYLDLNGYSIYEIENWDGTNADTYVKVMSSKENGKIVALKDETTTPASYKGYTALKDGYEWELKESADFKTGKYYLVNEERKQLELKVEVTSSSATSVNGDKVSYRTTYIETKLENDKLEYVSSGDYRFKENNTITVKYSINQTKGLAESYIKFSCPDKFYVSSVKLLDSTNFGMESLGTVSGQTHSFTEEDNAVVMIYTVDNTDIAYDTKTLIEFFEVTFTATENITTPGKYSFSLSSSSEFTDNDSTMFNPEYVDGISEASIYVRDDIKLTGTGTSKEYDGSAMTDTALGIAVNYYYVVTTGQTPTDAYAAYSGTKTYTHTDANNNKLDGYQSAVGTYGVEIEIKQTDTTEGATLSLTYSITKYKITIQLVLHDDEDEYGTDLYQFDTAEVTNDKYSNTSEIYPGVTYSSNAGDISEKTIGESTVQFFKVNPTKIAAATSKLTITGSIADTTNFVASNYEIVDLDLTDLIGTIEFMDVNAQADENLSHPTLTYNSDDYNMIVGKLAKQTSKLNFGTGKNYEYFSKTVYGLVGKSYSACAECEDENSKPYANLCPEYMGLESYDCLGWTDVKITSSVYSYVTKEDYSSLDFAKGNKQVFFVWDLVQFTVTYKLNYHGDVDDSTNNYTATVYTFSGDDGEVIKRGDSAKGKNVYRDNWFTLFENEDEDNYIWYTYTLDETPTKVYLKDLSYSSFKDYITEDNTITFYAEMVIDNSYVGDVNGDKLVNIDDVILYRRALLNSPAIEIIGSEANYIKLWQIANSEDEPDYEELFGTESTEDQDITDIIFSYRANVNYDKNFNCNLNDVVALRQALVTGYMYDVVDGAYGKYVIKKRIFSLLSSSESVTYNTTTYKTANNLELIYVDQNKMSGYLYIRNNNQLLNGNKYLFKYNGSGDLSKYVFAYKETTTTSQAFNEGYLGNTLEHNSCVTTFTVDNQKYVYVELPTDGDKTITHFYYSDIPVTGQDAYTDALIVGCENY